MYHFISHKGVRFKRAVPAAAFIFGQRAGNPGILSHCERAEGGVFRVTKNPFDSPGKGHILRRTVVAVRPGPAVEMVRRRRSCVIVQGCRRSCGRVGPSQKARAVPCCGQLSPAVWTQTSLGPAAVAFGGSRTVSSVTRGAMNRDFGTPDTCSETCD